MMLLANVEEMGVATAQPDELVVHTALLKEAEAVVGAIDRTVLVEVVE
jgi:hypothetical protein